MTTTTFDRSYVTVDKTAWGPGPWQDEPDKAQWIDPATGLDCLIVRSPASGALCGYVGVPPDHPWHSAEYGECRQSCGKKTFCDHSPEALLDVHGGVTFTGGCDHSDDESKGICHIPASGRAEDIWWFGFDCAHSEDVMPAFNARSHFPESTYRQADYVQAECAYLARQLQALA